ncbi:MAG: DNA polymerase III subunit gamma/tau [Rikenellaceae bacterium]
MPTARREDPKAEEKLKGSSAKIVEYISNSRPRFRPQFELMVVEGSKIKIEVPTEELRDEVRRNEIELMSYIVEMAGVDGYVELDVRVNERVEIKRLIKIEDKILHFSKLNTVIVELTEALDLQVES